MRIASLVPSATEALFALDLGDRVVAVTHECDFPEEARSLPHLTRSVIAPGLAAGEIDAEVRARTERGEALYELDEGLLERLAPDLIVTQALCEVCAVSYDDVRAVAARLPSRPRVVSLDPETLEEVLEDLPVLAGHAEVEVRGRQLRDRLGERLRRVRDAVAGAGRPRVVALEWLDPPFAAGHWVPEMIAIAGGTDALGRAGERSHTVEWEEVEAVAPEVVVAMPCGLGDQEAAAHARAAAPRLAALGATRVFAVDAAATFSRPGPRLVDGVELLAHLLHPELVEAPAGLGWVELADLA